MKPTDDEIKLAAQRHINDKHPGVQDGFVVGAKWLRDSPGVIALDLAEIECLEVFADGSVELLGDHSRSVMAKMMLDIAARAK